MSLSVGISPKCENRPQIVWGVKGLGVRVCRVSVSRVEVDLGSRSCWTPVPAQSENNANLAVLWIQVYLESSSNVGVVCPLGDQVLAPEWG